ncbi:MAG TPA: tetratricopeptide repeat protein, partial [Thermoplasmata archaeon]|nr:tetratricopeptide repeat protein [Thermoplasmata archaeon]
MAEGDAMIASRSLPSTLALEDVLRKGREALEAGQVEGALRTFDAAIRIKPTYAPAWRAKARALRTAGNPQAAVNCYREALRHEPEDEASWFGLALTLHALGRRADEVLAYEELLRRNPRSTPAWTNKGVALHETGKFAKALACYDRILEMRPELASAWNNRGAALLRLARPEDALAAFDEALALDPGFADAATNRKTVLARLGRDDPMPGSITLPPPTPVPGPLQTRVLSSLGLASIDAWRRDRPRSAEDFVAVGASLLDDGKPEASLAAFRKAEALGAGPLAILGIATALEVLHDSRLAAEAERLMTIEGIPRAAIAAARIRESAGDPAGARAALEA